MVNVDFRRIKLKKKIRTDSLFKPDMNKSILTWAAKWPYPPSSFGPGQKSKFGPGPSPDLSPGLSSGPSFGPGQKSKFGPDQKPKFGPGSGSGPAGTGTMMHMSHLDVGGDVYFSYIYDGIQLRINFLT